MSATLLNDEERKPFFQRSIGDMLLDPLPWTAAGASYYGAAKARNALGTKLLRDVASSAKKGVIPLPWVFDVEDAARKAGIRTTDIVHERHNSYGMPGSNFFMPDADGPGRHAIQISGDGRASQRAVATAGHEVGHALNRQTWQGLGRPGRAVYDALHRYRKLYNSTPGRYGRAALALGSAALSRNLDPDSAASTAVVYSPLLAASPLLAGEAAASLRGWKHLRRAGKGYGWRGALQNLAALGTYAAVPAASTATNYLLREHARNRQKEDKVTWDSVKSMVSAALGG